MSLKTTEPRAIASQLVFFFALAAALLLCCGLAVLYWIVVRHAFEEDNAVLADKVLALRAELERAGGPAGLNQELQILRRGERVGYLVRVLDSRGRAVAETPGMNGSLPVELFPDATRTPAANWAPKDLRAGGKLFSVAAAVQDAAGQSYTIQVAQDRSRDERFMREFALLVAGVLAAGILAAAAIAITVTRRGLRPLRQMTASLQRIGPARLHERLAHTGWPRELRPLASGFDEMLDRLEDSFTRLSQFSADLAHELRTPIGNIRGESEVALTRARTPQEYQAVIESTVGECERLAAIIDNLLFLARAEAAERQIARTQFDGRAALEKIASYYEAMADERQVAITLEGEGEVWGDPLLFGRAISNLVDNALRFTPAGGTIAIALRSRGDALEVSLTDSGVGISAEHLPRLFDRFYRADPARSSGGGTGLGLAIVKSIAELHGGTAQAMSHIGAGATFMMTLPQGPADERTQRTPKE